MVRLKYVRLTETPRQTLGYMFVNDKFNILFDCRILERGKDKRIPPGKYYVSKYQSPKHGQVLLIENVPGRSYIEIHAGNYSDDSRGCLICGSRFTDLNGDGFQDVENSRLVLKALLDLLPERTTIAVFE